MEFIQNFFTFQGRLNRAPYIKCYIIIWAISLLLTWLIDSSNSILLSMLGIIISVILGISAISLGVRRLHDLDKSGWFLLVAIIPFIGFFFQLYMLIAKGTDGANRFGADPLY